MRLTLIAFLLAGVAGCGTEPADEPGRSVEEPKLENGNGGEAEPVAKNGGDDGPESEFEATLKAAEQGDAKAQFNLGYMYRFGDGVPEDKAEAVKWHRKAAEQGDDIAQFMLGVMYELGEGVPSDAAEAAKWHLKAAAQGHAPAQHKVGVMYYDGSGVPKDYVEAYAWLSVAATNAINGSKDAKERSQQMKAELTPDQLIAAEKRIEELTDQIIAAQKRAAELNEQINADKAK